MTNQHPISPPPIVREQWQLESPFKVVSLEREDYMIDRAAQWGANQELEACCEWLDRRLFGRDEIAAFRAARSPKPPSLKEQALEQCNDYIDPDGIIRRALEQLPN
jgi:hypothetical protein